MSCNLNMLPFPTTAFFHCTDVLSLFSSSLQTVSASNSKGCALCDNKKPAQENWNKGLGGTRYAGPRSALQKGAVSSRVTLALPHTHQPLFLQDVTAFPGQINALCQTAGKQAIKGTSTDEPVKAWKNKWGNIK